MEIDVPPPDRPESPFVAMANSPTSPYEPSSPEVVIDRKYADDPEIISKLDWTGRPIEDVRQLSQHRHYLKELTWRNLSKDAIIILLTYFGKAPWQIDKLDIGRDGCDEGKMLDKMNFPNWPGASWLKSLNLSGTMRITTHVLTNIVRGHQYLTELNLSCTALTDVRPLEILKFTLRSLNVSHNYLVDSDLQFIVRHLFNVVELDISHNNLTNDGVLTHLVPWATQFTKLNVADQKTNYVHPQTIERLEHEMKQKKDEKTPLEQQEEERKQQTEVEVIPRGDLKYYLETYPNVTSLTFHREDHTKPFDFRFVPRFRHVQMIQTEGGLANNNTLAYLAKSRTCVTLHLRYIQMRDNMLAFAKAVRSNHVLKRLTFELSSVTLEVMKILLQSKSIESLTLDETRIFVYRGGFDLHQPTMVTIEEMRELVPFVLKNEALTYLNLGQFWNPDLIDPRINRHIDDNRKRLEAITQVAPLLAATQLGGPLRHSSIDIMPIVYDFLGIGALTPQHLERMKGKLVEASLKIEPVKVGEKRSAEETEARPLPFMFRRPRRQPVALPTTRRPFTRSTSVSETSPMEM